MGRSGWGETGEKRGRNGGETGEKRGRNGGGVGERWGRGGGEVGERWGRYEGDASSDSSPKGVKEQPSRLATSLASLSTRSLASRLAAHSALREATSPNLASSRLISW